MSEAVVVNPDWTGKARDAGIAARAIQRDQVPADLISTLIYLCSDESGFVTGQTISVDGGTWTTVATTSAGISVDGGALMR